MDQLSMFDVQAETPRGPLRAQADQVDPAAVLDGFEPTPAERQYVIDECGKRGMVWPE